jgi:uncharacterized membrane protein
MGRTMNAPMGGPRDVLSQLTARWFLRWLPPLPSWSRLLARIDRGAGVTPGEPGARRAIWMNRVFIVGIIVKALDGLFETVAGLPLLVIPASTIIVWVDLLTSHELDQDPDDLLGNLLRSSATHLLGGSSGLFIAVYLLAHGLVKLVLAWAVIRERLWAYPWMLAALVLFAAFQVYELVVGFHVGLLLLTLFDAVIIWLTGWEWRRRHAEHGRSAA